MRIIHTESSVGWGGQEIRVLTESRELMHRGHDVILFANPESLIASRAANYEVPVVHLRLRKKRPTEISVMFKTIGRFKPDIVCTHSSTDHWVVAAALLTNENRPGIVRTRHVSTVVKRNLATRWLYRSGCSAIVTTGESIRSNLISDGFVSDKKVFSIPTGIDLGFFKSVDKQQARARIKISPSIDKNTLLFGNIATLRSWKGQQDLIAAFAVIASDLPHSRLLIVGDGPQAGNLRALVDSLKLAERVYFTGYQSDVRDYFDAIDVFVFPSYANEGVPQAILQAMAYGLPIITTSAGSIEEAITDYPAATIVKARDTEQIANAMRAVKSPLLTRVVVPEKVYNRIDIRVMAKRMEEVYGAVIAENKLSQ